MDLDLAKQIFNQLHYGGIIKNDELHKTGHFINQSNKHLVIKLGSDLKPVVPQGVVDQVIKIAYVISVNGHLKADPEIMLAIDYGNHLAFPLSYRHELLSHEMFTFGPEANENESMWLYRYSLELLVEITTDVFKPVEKAAS